MEPQEISEFRSPLPTVRRTGAEGCSWIVAAPGGCSREEQVLKSASEPDLKLRFRSEARLLIARLLAADDFQRNQELLASLDTAVQNPYRCPDPVLAHQVRVLLNGGV